MPNLVDKISRKVPTARAIRNRVIAAPGRTKGVDLRAKYSVYFQSLMYSSAHSRGLDTYMSELWQKGIARVEKGIGVDSLISGTPPSPSLLAVIKGKQNLLRTENSFFSRLGVALALDMVMWARSPETMCCLIRWLLTRILKERWKPTGVEKAKEVLLIILQSARGVRALVEVIYVRPKGTIRDLLAILQNAGIQVLGIVLSTILAIAGAKLRQSLEIKGLERCPPAERLCATLMGVISRDSRSILGLLDTWTQNLISSLQDSEGKAVDVQGILKVLDAIIVVAEVILEALALGAICDVSMTRVKKDITKVMGDSTQSTGGDRSSVRGSPVPQPTVMGSVQGSPAPQFAGGVIGSVQGGSREAPSGGINPHDWIVAAMQELETVIPGAGATISSLPGTDIEEDASMSEYEPSTSDIAYVLQRAFGYNEHVAMKAASVATEGRCMESLPPETRARISSLIENWKLNVAV